MCAAIAFGSLTSVVCLLTEPLDAALVYVERKFRLSAEWLLSVARISGSLATVLVYQWFIALPSSPRMFLGCGPSLTSTLVTVPTTRTDRPRSGTIRSVPSGATSGEPTSVCDWWPRRRRSSLAFLACLARVARTRSSTTAGPAGVVLAVRLWFLRLGAVHPLDRLCHPGLPSGASARLRDRCQARTSAVRTSRLLVYLVYDSGWP